MVRVSIHESHEYDRHIVAAEAAHRAVRGETARHQFLAHIFGLEAGGNPPRDEIDHLLKVKRGKRY